MPQEQSKSRMRSIRARSSSLLISFSAIDLVWSGVSRCLVRGTSLPLIRARKTSPALMCRSEAPRSTAALMIFSNGSAGVRGRAKLRSGFAPGGKGLWRGTQKSHPVANLSHGFRGHAVGSCGPIRQDLVHPIRLFPELQGTLPDWGEGRDHIIGQYPLAVEAPPLGAPAVLGHQGDGFWWGEVLVQVINIAYLRGTGITPGYASRIRFRRSELLPDLVRTVQQADGVAHALGHLGLTVKTGNPLCLGQDWLGLRKEVLTPAKLRVPFAGDFPTELEVLDLILSHGNQVRPVEQDVRSHQNGIVEQSRRDTLETLRLIFELRHSLKLAQRRDRVEQPLKFGMLRDV